MQWQNRQSSTMKSPLAPTGFFQPDALPARSATTVTGPQPRAVAAHLHPRPRRRHRSPAPGGQGRRGLFDSRPCYHTVLDTFMWWARRSESSVFGARRALCRLDCRSNRLPRVGCRSAAEPHIGGPDNSGRANALNLCHHRARCAMRHPAIIRSPRQTMAKLGPAAVVLALVALKGQGCMRSSVRPGPRILIPRTAEAIEAARSEGRARGRNGSRRPVHVRASGSFSGSLPCALTTDTMGQTERDSEKGEADGTDEALHSRSDCRSLEML